MKSHYNRGALSVTVLPTPSTLKPSKINCLPNTPFDKFYIDFNISFKAERLISLISSEGTEKLIRSSAKRNFYRNPEYSARLKFKNIELTILSNKLATQVHVNPKTISKAALDEFIKLCFGSERGRFSRIDYCLDLKIKLDTLLDRTRVLRKKAFRKFMGVVSSMSMEPKAGACYEVDCTEYFGKQRSIVFYNSGKVHGLGENVSRIEVRCKRMRSCPVSYYDELPLIAAETLYYDIKLPISFKRKKFSHRLTTRLNEFHRQRKAKRVGLAMGSMIYRSDSKSKADSVMRAVKSREKGYFDLQDAFNKNFEQYLRQKITFDEIEFVKAVKECLKNTS